MHTARIATPDKAHAGWRFRALSRLARFYGRDEIPSLFAVLNIHRRLFTPWLWFASRLMPRGTLPAPVRELLILRTGWNCRCRYEWAQHVVLASQVGVSDADIVRVASGPAAFSDLAHQGLLQACDDLCTHDQVSAATWASLSARWGQVELIEIVMLVGHYRMLAGFLNSTGVQLEVATEAQLQAFHERIRPLVPWS